MRNRKAPPGTVKKFLRLISRYKFSAVLSLLCSAASVALTLFIPFLFGRAIDLIIGAGAVDITAVVRILILAFALAGVCAVFSWLAANINNRITLGVSQDIRNACYEKINSLPLSYLDSHPSGDTLSRVISDVEQLSDGLLLGFTQFFSGALTIAGTLIFLLTLSWRVALVVVCLTPVSLFAAKFIARRSYAFFSEQSAVRAGQTALINEFTANLKTVKAFAKEKDMLGKFSGINEKLRKTSLKAIFYSSITNPATRFVNAIVYAAAAFAGAAAVISPAGSLSVGMLTCVLSYANQYTKPFNEISGVAAELQNALSCAARVFELLEAAGECPDAENAAVISEPSGNIALSDVCFSYTPDRELIKNLNLNVSSGQKIAIVGPTGCGKTTLINLLMRFYDTDSGSIFFDGSDIKNIKRASLRSCWGMVLQESWLMAGSVRDNIRMGKPRASDAEIIEAARRAHSYSFIKKLPNGLDTVIGEDSTALSQGQKQLLCITRVMLSLPPALILDEATSSIDSRTEIRIQKAFSELMQGRTSFIVAHRLSTILEADLILVMNNGKVIEQGTHEQLLAKHGFYERLFNSQFET